MGYAHLDDCARGPILGYVPGSPADQTGPFTGPTTGDVVDDGSPGHFADDAIRDDDSLYASHVLLHHDGALMWACFSYFSCIS